MIPFLVSGQTDFAGQINFLNIPALQASPNIHVITSGNVGSKAEQLIYNVTAYPYNMTQFRQAMVYGINSSAVVQNAYDGFAQPANNAQGLVSPAYPTYNPNQPKYDYNPSKALDLLHSIGFTGGGSAGPLKFPNGPAFSTTIWTTVDRASDIQVASVVSQDLSNLGMQVSYPECPNLKSYW